MQRLKSLFYVVVGFFAALGVLSITQSDAAHALGGGPTPASLQSQVNDLIAQVNNQAAQIAALQNQVQTLQSLPGSQVTAQGVAVLNRFSLQDANGSPSASGKELHLVGVNLHLEDGSGYTDDGINGETTNTTLTGLGNLIIGYNGLRGKDGQGKVQDFRTGSHNLVLGDQNNETSYGGLVAGTYNTVSGSYDTVTGGRSNTASGYVATVSGGGFGLASGNESSISGGEYGTASGYAASISGGQGNLASGTIASISGGQGNTASGSYASSVSGGLGVVSSAYVGWGAGGFFYPTPGPGTFHSP